MASGKAKYLAGLRDLSGGLQLLDARKKQKLADAFEREKYDYGKEQDALTEKRLSDALAASIANQEIDNQRQRRAGILSARDSMFGNMIKKGNLDLAGQREERLMKALSLRGSGSGGTATVKAPPKTPFDLREETKSLARSIAAEKQTPEVSFAPEEALSGLLRKNSLRLAPPAITMKDRPYEQFMPEASRYTAASDLPVEEAEADAVESMPYGAWAKYADATIADQLADLPGEEFDAIAVSPELSIILTAPKGERRRLLDEFLSKYGAAQ